MRTRRSYIPLLAQDAFEKRCRTSAEFSAALSEKDGFILQMSFSVGNGDRAKAKLSDRAQPHHRALMVVVCCPWNKAVPLYLQPRHAPTLSFVLRVPSLSQLPCSCASRCPIAALATHHSAKGGFPSLFPKRDITEKLRFDFSTHQVDCSLFLSAPLLGHALGVIPAPGELRVSASAFRCPSGLRSPEKICAKAAKIFLAPPQKDATCLGSGPHSLLRVPRAEGQKG